MCESSNTGNLTHRRMMVTKITFHITETISRPKSQCSDQELAKLD
jgi:hypothetical protein